MNTAPLEQKAQAPNQKVTLATNPTKQKIVLKGANSANDSRSTRHHNPER